MPGPPPVAICAVHGSGYVGEMTRGSAKRRVNFDVSVSMDGVKHHDNCQAFRNHLWWLYNYNISQYYGR